MAAPATVGLRNIDRSITKRVMQLPKRLPVLDTDIVGKALEYPLRHAIIGKATGMLHFNDMSEFVRAKPSGRARWCSNVPPMHDPACFKIDPAQESGPPK